MSITVQIMQFFDQLQNGLNTILNSPSFWLLLSPLILMVIALACSYPETFRLRMLLTLAIGLAVFFLSIATVEPTNRNFYLNLSTEFISAALTVVILGDWIKDARAFALFSAGIIWMLIIPIVIAKDMFVHDIFMNLGPDLLSAFLIFLLLNREVIWGRESRAEIRARRDLEQQQFEAELLREEEEKTWERLKMQSVLWQHYELQVDMFIRVRGKTKQEIHTKIEHLTPMMRVIPLEKRMTIKKDESDNMYACFYVVIRKPTAKVKVSR